MRIKIIKKNNLNNLVPNRTSDVNIPKTTMPTIAPFGSTTSSISGPSSLGNILQPPATKSTAPFQIPKTSTTAPVSTPTTTGPPKPPVTTTQPPPTTADQIPSWLKNNNIETIINKWSKDLENCSKKFMEQVQEINQWDQKIIENNGRVNADLINV